MANIEELKLERFFPDLDLKSDYISLQPTGIHNNYIAITRIKHESIESRLYRSANIDLSFSGNEPIRLGLSHAMDVAFISRHSTKPCSFVFRQLPINVNVNSYVCEAVVKSRLLALSVRNRLEVGGMILHNDLTKSSSITMMLMDALMSLSPDQSILDLSQQGQDFLLFGRGRSGTIIFEKHGSDLKDRIVID